MFDSINIIGYGYVGGALGYLCEKNKVKFNVCDLNCKSGTYNYFTSELELLIGFSESKNDINYYFISVPTPSKDDGSCDISIITSILDKLNNLVTKKTRVIIKSTLVPGSCQNFNETYKNIDIILSPEFLREATFKDDMYNAEFVLVGLSQNTEITEYADVLNLFRCLYVHNKDIDIYMKSYEECELFKYTLNTFLATKITFFNEIHELCEKMNLDYQKLKELFSLDSRIGTYGTNVPGPGNKFYGFFLKCLPKETQGMIKLQEKLELSSEFMSCIDKRNKYFNKKQVKK
jgi:UDPglucose 6-dehydrogenase